MKHDNSVPDCGGFRCAFICDQDTDDKFLDGTTPSDCKTECPEGKDAHANGINHLICILESQLSDRLE